jgi:hypothetical protein
MNRCKLLLATLGAVGLICVVAGTASARTFSISNQTWRAIFYPFLEEEERREPELREQIEITSELATTYRCRLTLEGSFHTRTIAKVAETLIGYVNRAALPECSGFMSTRLLTETLPWHVRYRSFSGALPNIVSLSTSIIGFAMSIREPTFRVVCLGRSTAEEPFILRWDREAGGRLREASASGSITMGACPFSPIRVIFGGRTVRGITGWPMPPSLTLI